MVALHATYDRAELAGVTEFVVKIIDVFGPGTRSCIAESVLTAEIPNTVFAFIVMLAGR